MRSVLIWIRRISQEQLIIQIKTKEKNICLKNDLHFWDYCLANTAYLCTLYSTAPPAVQSHKNKLSKTHTLGESNANV